MSLLWPDYIDRAVPIARKERMAVRREAWKRWTRQGRYLLSLAACIVAVVVLMRVARYLLEPWVGKEGAALIRLGAVAVFTFAVVLVYRHYVLAPFVRAVLREKGYEVCWKCGYWLAKLGSDIDRCPECGAERRPVKSG